MTKQSLIGFTINPDAVPVREGVFEKIDLLIIQVKDLEKLLTKLLDVKRVRLYNLMSNGTIFNILLGKHTFVFLKPFFEGYPDFDIFSEKERYSKQEQYFNECKAELMHEIKSHLSKHSTCINREYAMARNVSDLLGIDRRFYGIVLRKDSSLKEFTKKSRPQRGPKGISFKIQSIDNFFKEDNY